MDCHWVINRLTAMTLPRSHTGASEQFKTLAAKAGIGMGALQRARHGLLVPTDDERHAASLQQLVDQLQLHATLAKKASQLHSEKLEIDVWMDKDLFKSNLQK